MTQVRIARLAADTAPTPIPEPQAPLSTLAEALPAESTPTHLLHFEPLSAQGAGLDIPCDPQGRVGLDALGEKLRNDYFFARALIGRLFARPTVRQAMPMLHA
jgi:hypothetical protein